MRVGLVRGFPQNGGHECDFQTRFSSVQGLRIDDASRGSMLGSQGNKEEWNVLLRRDVLVDEGNEWVNHL